MALASQMVSRRAFVPIPNPAVACRPSDDGWLVLVNLDTARSVALNPTAGSIWSLIDGRRDSDRILRALDRVWDDVPADAAAHVDEVLSTLEEAGFVGRVVATCGRRRVRASSVNPGLEAGSSGAGRCGRERGPGPSESLRLREEE